MCGLYPQVINRDGFSTYDRLRASAQVVQTGAVYAERVVWMSECVVFASARRGRLVFSDPGRPGAFLSFDLICLLCLYCVGL